jgi:uncharacterized protein (DUF2252 family)
MATGSIRQPTVDDRVAVGRDARATVPRGAHGEWAPARRRPDPVGLLQEQARTRVPELVPIRYGRMLASPFAFYRGAAYIMASDLALTPTSGISVQLCGDAHLSNFGGFAAPDRRLVFDINDFDETLPGPWEWDVKRLVASLEVAGRDLGFGVKPRRRLVTASARAYRTTMRELSLGSNLDVWYARVEADELIERARGQAPKRALAQVERSVGRAQHKDSMRALKRLSEQTNGRPRIVNDPPLVVPIAELLPGVEGEVLTQGMRELFRDYRASLRPDVRHILETYEFVDLARKVVGVGSVGTRAWIVLLLGRDSHDPLFLQAKESQPSVLEPFLARSAFHNHGRRVVEGQRLLQPSSDIMLGWIRTTEVDGEERDYYLRQLWDWKLSADVDSMGPAELDAYGQLCGATLARAHARSGDRIAIAAYMGSGDRLDRALHQFAEAYADQNALDYDALVEAVQSGRIEAQTGI